MEIQGKIIQVLPERTGTSANGAWRMASYVLETIEQYPRHMVFDVHDGRAGRIARLGISAGKTYKLWFNIDAREYEGRWYNSVVAWDAREVNE